jgi:hypothetical protein
MKRSCGRYTPFFSLAARTSDQPQNKLAIKIYKEINSKRYVRRKDETYETLF